MTELHGGDGPPIPPVPPDGGKAVYPLGLDLAGRRVVVVGGGRVALRRTRALVEAGALVTVIAPRFKTDFLEQETSLVTRPAAGSGITLVRRDYRRRRPGRGLAGARGHRRPGRQRGRRGGGGPGPDLVRARRRRRRLGGLDAGRHPARRRHRRGHGRRGPAPVPGAARGHRHGAGRGPAAAAPSPLRPAARGTGTGSVALVGGGPGDAGLITVRGRRLLAEADVVVVDKLAPRSLLAELDPGVEIIDAGKAPHAHNLTQDQINELIVRRALAGQRVVRLKGGDPFVFGRGGEEALACVRAGVPFSVVPGVTSAVAVPAYAGIPVTHRGVTQDFAVVSAHLDPSHPGATVDWAALAQGPGTLVLLMGVAHLEEISAELIKRGRDAATPVAVIRDGTMPGQQVLTSTLGAVAAEADQAGHPAAGRGGHRRGRPAA